jgi:hypothetical protein
MNPFRTVWRSIRRLYRAYQAFIKLSKGGKDYWNFLQWLSVDEVLYSAPFLREEKIPHLNDLNEARDNVGSYLIVLVYLSSAHSFWR